AAGTAYIPALSDCVIMVKESGSLALGGPPLVEAVLGEKVTEQELGGWEVHNSRSGVSHFSADSDEDGINIARRYLSYFPSHCNEPPPRIEGAARGPLDDSVLSIVPDEPQAPFDMKEVISHLNDPGPEPLYYMDAFGGSILTGWIRMGGFSVGVVASQSLVLGGVLENDSSVKAARFISLCDAFGIPLLFLQDVPGFLVGSRVEKNGIIRHGAKMLFAVSQATVPKMTIIVRKAYGAGYFVMCGKGFEPDYIAAWPTAEIALMGAEGAINILYGKKLSALPPEERTKQRKALEDGYRADVNAYSAAARFGIDDVIDPRHTVQRLVRVLELTRTKERPKHPGMHGIFPV
ncbi:MAG: hypothetical protein KDK33_08160, partial [Leptospiraceae bacterium]|nr:hypothetical protein [Leptospiraceae bacterium]